MNTTYKYVLYYSGNAGLPDVCTFEDIPVVTLPLRFSTLEGTDFDPIAVKTGEPVRWSFTNNYTITSNDPKTDNPNLEGDAGLDGTEKDVKIFFGTYEGFTQLNLNHLQIPYASVSSLLDQFLDKVNEWETNFALILYGNIDVDTDIQNKVETLDANGVNVVMSNFRLNLTV